MAPSGKLAHFYSLKTLGANFRTFFLWTTSSWKWDFPLALGETLNSYLFRSISCARDINATRNRLIERHDKCMPDSVFIKTEFNESSPLKVCLRLANWCYKISELY
ncbi:unnamed protein product [Blepharisma stoltei]|uniref:Uncharacterized protein n=1 Tax=Blepharisma stoltei TaxID=1481888 RepID=A0AAU9IYN3_9CILI|nr:unnamed protein product [Blepharisma stoltei]